jgi:hypothetical protein
MKQFLYCIVWVDQRYPQLISIILNNVESAEKKVDIRKIIITLSLLIRRDNT